MAEQVSCTFCGKSIPLDSKFCPFCGKGHGVAATPGTDAGIPAQLPARKSPPTEKMSSQYQQGQSPPDGAMGWMKRHKILVIVLAVVGLILACCICSYLLPFLQAY